ncbi:hypothetical protein GCM10010468_79460 [Actinocorallia longicatena]|uniref:DUF4232 domain-containing protein n=2 Tax=Actinocorallia longicatena TaxID=111803 RepID=A0ABP6QMC0_9ACTN
MGYEDEGYSDTYWRRRAIALAAVLLTLGGAAYACTGEKPTPVKNAAATGDVSPAPTPTEVPVTALPAPPMPTVTVTVTQQATVAAPRRPGDACASGDLVANLTPVKADFAKTDAPQFRMTVVNTGRLDCTFDVGAGRFVAKIKSGSDRVWSSAHCAAAGGTSIQMLRRGIPYVGGLAWDRRRSRQGCAAPRPKALAGTYVIQAEGGGVKTPKAVFTLR